MPAELNGRIRLRHRQITLTQLPMPEQKPWRGKHFRQKRMPPVAFGTPNAIWDCH